MGKGLLFFLTVAAGVMMPLQAGINSLLGKELKSSFLSGLVSFFVGTLVLIGVCAFVRDSWDSLKVTTQVPWWYLTGGVLGAFFVTIMIFAAPRIGAMSMLVFVLLGQFIGSLVFDQFGWFGYPVHPLSIWRVAGVLLVLAGAVLIHKF